jgi:hypothetical protein
MKFLFLITIIACCHSAQSQFRKYSNEFLNIGAGARALGMGGAQIASSGDGTSGYWNPAGLNKLNGPTLSFQHAEYFAGIGKYDFISLAKPLADSTTAIGVSLMRFAVDDIPNTLFLVEPDGTVNYNNVSTFSSADYAALFSLSKKIMIKEDMPIYVGGNAKIIHRKVGSFAKAWGFGFDVGIQAQVKKWGLAAVLRDATSTFNSWSFSFSDREKEILYLTNNEIPISSAELTSPRLSVGAFRDFQLDEKLKLRAETSLDLTFDGRRNTLIKTGFVSVDPRLGVELVFAENVFLRAGVSNFQQALADKDLNAYKKAWIYQPSGGIGFKLKDIKIDYAFTNLANQSNPLFTHVFTIALGLRKKVTEEE